MIGSLPITSLECGPKRFLLPTNEEVGGGSEGRKIELGTIILETK